MAQQAAESRDPKLCHPTPPSELQYAAPAPATPRLMHGPISQCSRKPEPITKVPTRPLCNQVLPAPGSEPQGGEKLGTTTHLSALEHLLKDAEV